MRRTLKRFACAAAATSAVAAILGIGGCDAPAELRAIVAEARPENALRVSCHGSGSLTSFDDYPTYDCTFFAPGSRRTVAASIVAALESQAFRVRCGVERSRQTIQIWGTRGTLRSLGSVSTRGSTLDLAADGEPLGINPPGRTPLGDHRSPPEGHVIVQLDASDRERPQELPENPEWHECAGLLAGSS